MDEVALASLRAKAASLKLNGLLAHWGLLDFAGGAPLAALQLHAENFGRLAEQFARDIEDLQMRRAGPREHQDASVVEFDDRGLVGA